MRTVSPGLLGVLCIGLFSGCASLPTRTFVVGGDAPYVRDQCAILLVSKGNEVTSINETLVSVTGKHPEDEIALAPGKYKVKANQTGRPVRSHTADIDAKSGHVYRLVAEELPIQNLTITFQNGTSRNLGGGSFYIAKIAEVTNAAEVQARFSSAFTSAVVRVQMGGPKK